MIVTFDFDQTLSRKDVQEYCKHLLEQGLAEIYVVTSRYDELHKHRYPANPKNDDLYEVTDALGIPRERIRFTCMEKKWTYLKETNVLWHLDDWNVELDEINKHTNTTGISVLGSNWKQKCERLMCDYLLKTQLL